MGPPAEVRSSTTFALHADRASELRKEWGAEANGRPRSGRALCAQKSCAKSKRRRRQGSERPQRKTPAPARSARTSMRTAESSWSCARARMKCGSGRGSTEMWSKRRVRRTTAITARPRRLPPPAPFGAGSAPTPRSCVAPLLGPETRPKRTAAPRSRQTCSALRADGKVGREGAGEFAASGGARRRPTPPIPSHPFAPLFSIPFPCPSPLSPFPPPSYAPRSRLVVAFAPWLCSPQSSHCTHCGQPSSSSQAQSTSSASALRSTSPSLREMASAAPAPSPRRSNASSRAARFRRSYGESHSVSRSLASSASSSDAARSSAWLAACSAARRLNGGGSARLGAGGGGAEADRSHSPARSRLSAVHWEDEASSGDGSAPKAGEAEADADSATVSPSAGGGDGGERAGSLGNGDPKTRRGEAGRSFLPASAPPLACASPLPTTSPPASASPTACASPPSTVSSSASASPSKSTSVPTPLPTPQR